MVYVKVLLHTYLICILCALISAQSDMLSKHQFHAPLDEDSNFELHWSFDNALKTMTFTIDVKTTGWVGFGISPYTGQMPGSDVVIGWVDDKGKVYLQDRFATSRSLPSLDDQQDYKLISGSEVDGKTTLTFSRKWDTKDKNDLPLEYGTTRLIWSYHEKDPSSPNDIPMHQKMGARSLNLFERMPDSHIPKLPPDTQTFDFVAPNVTVPSAKTTYWCVGMKMPEVKEKHHIVKIDPIIAKGNEGLIHHMTIYECESDSKWHGFSSECTVENMPIHLFRCRGGSALVVWAVGGESVIFPSHAGFPLGDKSSPKFAIIEWHYDNPQQKSGVVDTSGFRLHFTKQLRQYDIGVFAVGSGIYPTMFIPDRQTKWDITGYCPKQCTERAVPKGGINAFAALLHTHLAGYALTTRHFRNGKELPVLAENKHYDFNYQEFLYLKDEVKILPGDSMALTCSYQTTDRDKLTLSGIGTEDEMCFTYIYYYPKMQFAMCISHVSLNDMIPFWKKLMESGKMPAIGNGTDAVDTALKNTAIKDQKLFDQLNKIQTYSTQEMLCTYANDTLVMEKYPMSIPNFKPVVNYTATPNNNAAITCSANLISTILIYSVMALMIAH